MNSGRILTLKVFCQLKNGCAYEAQKRTECLCPWAVHLLFIHSPNQAALDSNGVTETERDDEAEGNCASADRCTFRGVAQLIDPWMVTEELKTCLTDSVAGPLIVECVFDITLVGQSEDPVLFHAGD